MPTLSGGFNTAGNSAKSGGVNWDFPNSALTNNNDEALGFSNTTTNYLTVTDWLETIDSSYTLNSITVSVKWGATGDEQPNQNAIHLIVGGTIQTSVNKSTGADVPFGAPGSTPFTDTWVFNSTDLATLSIVASTLNQSNFGVAIAVEGISMTYTEVYVDYISIEVDYSTGSSPGVNRRYWWRT